jgi:hypothetical protein
MKDRLEQFIEQNRDSFDSFDPDQSEKIWTKVSSARNMKKSRKVFLKYFSRVAAVLMIFVLSYVFHDLMDWRKETRLAKEKRNDIYKQLPELKEAENYYSNLVSGKMKEIKPFLAKNPGINTAVNADLMELDSIYSSLKNDLKDNVANDQIIEAMIQNYRLKLQILEELQDEIKREKMNNYDKPKVNI